MGEIIGCCVSLQSELQLSDYFLFDSYFKSNVRNRSRIVEPALYLNQSVSFLAVIDVLFDSVYCFDDILDGTKDALPSHHVTDCEQYRLYSL